MPLGRKSLTNCNWKLTDLQRLFIVSGMTKFNAAQIKAKALQLLSGAPDGLRYGTVVKLVHAAAPETPIKSVHGAVHDLRVKGDEIAVPTKGLWVLKANLAVQSAPAPSPVKAGFKACGLPKVSEEQFYTSLADWLRDDADEVTEAAPLGGAVLKDKWGTPDVVGISKPRTGDFVPFPLEIAAVEVKVDPQQSITAFGQACAYRLFAHRVYLAMPETLSAADRDRLESLCLLFGIGLILFKPFAGDPAYRLEVRASRNTPDMFYANEFARRLQQADPKVFHKLF